MEPPLQSLDKVTEVLLEFGVQYGFQIAGAVIILIAGYVISRWLSRLVVRHLERRGSDPTMRQFLGSVIRLGVLGFTVIIALSKFGISITPLVAALGATAFGATFALQGPLSNYGAGLTIILTRPFAVGHTISLGAVAGVVKHISLANTYLTTSDEETITIPNRKIVGEILQNSGSTRLVESRISIGYDSDPNRALEIVRRAVVELPGISTEKPPQIGIEAFSDVGIAIEMRFWVPTPEYYRLLHAANLAVYNALVTQGITVAVPQREIRLMTVAPPGAPDGRLA